jgi:flagellar biosynthesis/type III secretory pathway protein FliH
MYVYNYRIFDRFRRPVVSLAVLGDEQHDWRPNQFAYSLWGFSLRVEFPIVKLLDYAGREAELESERNPFAAVVLAHLKSRETRDRPEERRTWKVRLVKSLFYRGLTAEEIRQLFRIIDWLLELPRELEREFQEEIHRFEEERQMPYVTSIERMAREQGLEQGREQGRREALQQGIEVALDLKFGEAGQELLPLVQAEQRVDVLLAVQRAIRTVQTLAEVRELLQ